jgi:tRNA modification GTPase
VIRFDDTIAALATGAAPGGICVVRISGPEALAIARRFAHLPDPMPPRTALLARVRRPSGELVDEAIVLYFRAPASFTGEDVVEIHGHGGVAHGQDLAALALACGARAAEPGEFSRRAVVHGKLSLERAEAIADLAEAETAAGLRAARAQLTGALGAAVDSIARDALALRAAVEASLDFPDDADPPPYPDRAAALAARCESLLSTFAFGRRLKDGVRVVLAGMPNVGKSSLFNALLAQERALVDPRARHHAGTTPSRRASTWTASPAPWWTPPASETPPAASSASASSAPARR